jgi:hypothetical protein
LVDNIHAKAAFDGIETTKSMFLSSMKEYNIREFKPALGDAVSDKQIRLVSIG